MNNRTWLRSRATASVLSCVVAALLLSGCGDPEPAPGASSIGPAADASAPASTGPCDRDHQDAAIARARAALHRRLGPVSLSTPQAEFESICLRIQVAGQPEDAPVWGWMVSVRAGPADADAASRDHATDLQAALPLPHDAVTGQGRTEVTLAPPPQPVGRAQPGTDSPLLPPPPVPGGDHSSGAPPPVVVNAFAILGPDGVPGTAIRRYAEFVQVDGTVTDF